MVEISSTLYKIVLKLRAPRIEWSANRQIYSSLLKKEHEQVKITTEVRMQAHMGISYPMHTTEIPILTSRTTSNNTRMIQWYVI